MVDMTAPYAGDYVRSSELAPHVRLPVVIRFAGVEQVGQDQKLAAVLSVVPASDNTPWPRKVILNKSNAATLVAAFGKDGAAWVGQAITVWADPDVMYKGERVGGLKVAVGHQVQPIATGAIPMPGPVHSAPASAPGNGAADPVAAGTAMNMAGHVVPLPTGMPSAMPDSDDVIPL